MTHPRMYRAFKPEFLAFMSRFDGWPSDRATINWFLLREYPKDRSYLSDLRQGRYAPELYAYHLIEMWATGSDSPDLELKCQVFRMYAAERGIIDFAYSSRLIDCLVAHTCTPLVHGPPGVKLRKNGQVGSLREGFAGLASVPFRLFLPFATCGVTTPEHARDVATWIYVRLAQNRLPDGPSLSEGEAIASAEQIIMTPFHDYTARIQQWADKSPWSVVFARRRGKHIGASIMLPVRQEAYEDIRSGQLAGSELKPELLTVPSNHILFEALAENPAALQRGTSDLEKWMAMAIAIQHAALMRFVPGKSSSRFRFLAPEATPENRDLMIAMGFAPTGARDPRRDVIYWEREVDYETGDNLVPHEAVTLHVLGKSCGRVPPRCKQR